MPLGEPTPVQLAFYSTRHCAFSFFGGDGVFREKLLYTLVAIDLDRIHLGRTEDYRSVGSQIDAQKLFTFNADSLEDLLGDRHLAIPVQFREVHVDSLLDSGCPERDPSYQCPIDASVELNPQRRQQPLSLG